MFNTIIIVLLLFYLIYFGYKVVCFFYLELLLNKIYKIQGYEVKEVLESMLEYHLECEYTCTYRIKHNKNNIKIAKQYLKTLKEIQ